AYDRQYGVLKRLGGSPLSRGGLVIAKPAAGATPGAPPGGVVLRAAGARPRGAPGAGRAPGPGPPAAAPGPGPLPRPRPAPGRNASRRGGPCPRERSVPRVPHGRRHRPAPRPSAGLARDASELPPGGRALGGAPDRAWRPRRPDRPAGRARWLGRRRDCSGDAD